MSSNDIDNLFRQSLDDHATPPPAPDALWARLQQDQQAASDERLDALFRTGLTQHATPPARELWERLEDEHLRPRKQQPAAAWWPRALAAVVALLLVAGSVGLWTGGQLGNVRPGQEMASAKKSRPAAKPATGATPSAHSTGTNPGETSPLTASAPAALATQSAPQQENLIAQATPANRPASGYSKGEAGAENSKLRRSQPGSSATPGRMVARTKPAPAGALHAADERPTAPAASNVLVAAATSPQKPAPAPAVADGGTVVVDVRPGFAPNSETGAALAHNAVAMSDEESEEPQTRRLGGRLLRQAGRLARGERLSLSELTGLPENVTVQAQVGNRTLTKSIQL
jgi:hypothetical protein